MWIVLLLAVVDVSLGFVSITPSLTKCQFQTRRYDCFSFSAVNNTVFDTDFYLKINENFVLNNLNNPTEALSLLEECQVENLVSEVLSPKVNEYQAESDILPLEMNRKELVLPEKDLTIPTVRQIAQFSITGIAIYLCSPLLSLIDTSAVGLLSGTAQQAALNPAVSVTEYTAFLIAFMYTGTTNLVASAQNRKETVKAFRASLQLSTFVGILFGTVTMASSVYLLRWMVGGNALDPVVFNAALKYIRIRALGMPAAAITGSAQAACLGMKDIRSPLMILLSAASINFVADMLLVGCKHSWIGGCAGAAWATVFSQYAAMSLFLFWLTTRRFPNVLAPTKGLLRGKLALLKFPPRHIAKKFWPYFLPVTTTAAGRVSAYVSMAHVISSTIGTTAMAAQQVILSFFFCLCPAAESISLTGQSYVPEFMAGNHTTELFKLTTTIMKSSLLFATGQVLFVASMPLLCRFFTSDPNVVSSIRSILPLVAAWFAYHAPFMAAEGILLGRKDLGFLGKMYGFFFFALPFIYQQMKSASLSGIRPATLTSVWQVFILYGLFRFLILGTRLIQQTIRTMRLNKKEEYTVFA